MCFLHLYLLFCLAEQPLAAGKKCGAHSTPALLPPATVVNMQNTDRMPMANGRNAMAYYYTMPALLWHEVNICLLLSNMAQHRPSWPAGEDKGRHAQNAQNADQSVIAG